MSTPPPSRFYQSRWGNLYSAANSDDDSNDMSSAAPTPTVAVAGLTTKAVAVVADAVIARDVIADEYAPIADATHA